MNELLARVLAAVTFAADLAAHSFSPGDDFVGVPDGAGREDCGGAGEAGFVGKLLDALPGQPEHARDLPRPD